MNIPVPRDRSSKSEQQKNDRRERVNFSIFQSSWVKPILGKSINNENEPNDTKILVVLIERVSNDDS